MTTKTAKNKISEKKAPKHVSVKTGIAHFKIQNNIEYFVHLHLSGPDALVQNVFVQPPSPGSAATCQMAKAAGFEGVRFYHVTAGGQPQF